MSVFSMVYSGTAPIGYMLAGTAAERYGANTAFLICGLLTIVLIVMLNLYFSSKTKLIK